MQLMSRMHNKTDLQNWGTDLKQAKHTETAAAVRNTLDDLEVRITHNGTATGMNSKTIQKHVQAILDLRHHTNDLENRSRHCKIHISGVPESEPNEELRDMATKLFLEVLNKKDPPNIEIERIHRVGAQRGYIPRDILCCLVRFEVKEQVLQKACTIDGIHFEDNVINLYQDLSASTITQHRLLKPLTLVMQGKSISYKRGFPFALLAHKGGKLMCSVVRQISYNSANNWTLDQLN
ncbi:hypothetical protein XELAEV_18035547mg [Xenopus laevis]|uniref:L1 transposable element RRM domain-containing protein n=1 Tax=Xenopus laevis TaxID=8355 RepID=A0A974CGH0_XENLA|nr:hypothetical protein XELAEV_18035547mg [Xenopus laevis]